MGWAQSDGKSRGRGGAVLWNTLVFISEIRG